MPIKAYRKTFEERVRIENPGEEIDEEEDCAGDMLGCLDHRVPNGRASHADLGSFGHLWALSRQSAEEVHSAYRECRRPNRFR